LHVDPSRHLVGVIGYPAVIRIHNTSASHDSQQSNGNIKR